MNTQHKQLNAAHYRTLTHIFWTDSHFHVLYWSAPDSQYLLSPFLTFPASTHRDWILHVNTCFTINLTVLLVLVLVLTERGVVLFSVYL